MNCIHPPSLTLPRCRYMGSAWLSRAASWRYRSVATDQPVEKQKIRLLCNFYFVFGFPRLPRASSVAGWRCAYVSTDRFAGEPCSNHLFDLNGVQSHRLIHCAWA